MNRPALILLSAFILTVAACVPPDSNNGNNGNNGIPEGSCDNPQLITTDDVSGGATLAEGCYLAEESLAVQDGTLTLEPGVIINFARDTRLTVDGRRGGILISRGSQEKPVFFTGSETNAGFWEGIYFDNSTDSSNELDHTVVEYGGGAEFGSGLGKSNLGVGGFVGATRLTITNSTFRHSAGHGIDVESESEFLDFASNTFEGNADYALSIPANQRRMIDTDTTFKGEGASSYVEVRGGVTPESGTWADLKGDAFTSVTANIGINSRMEFAPGVELHFGDNVLFEVDGRDGGIVVANGEANNKIVFTRLGTVQWKGIYFDNSDSSQNIINHAVISYGGFSEIEDQKANLFIGGFVGETSLTVTNSEITNSDGAGIFIEPDSYEKVNQDIDTSNTFSDNAGGDVMSN